MSKGDGINITTHGQSGGTNIGKLTVEQNVSTGRKLTQANVNDLVNTVPKGSKLSVEYAANDAESMDFANQILGVLVEQLGCEIVHTTAVMSAQPMIGADVNPVPEGDDRRGDWVLRVGLKPVE